MRRVTKRRTRHLSSLYKQRNEGSKARYSERAFIGSCRLTHRNPSSCTATSLAHGHREVGLPCWRQVLNMRKSRLTSGTNRNGIQKSIWYYPILRKTLIYYSKEKSLYWTLAVKFSLSRTSFQRCSRCPRINH